MTEKTIKILSADHQVFQIGINQETDVEEVITVFCRRLNIRPVCRYLFGLRYDGAYYMSAGTKLWDCPAHTSFEARIRFRIKDIDKISELDVNTLSYYFLQARDDILNNRIGDISYEKHKEELIGLGVTDMYRVMIERSISTEVIVQEYKKYIPKEVLKHHKFFVKKPMLDALIKLEKSGTRDVLQIKYRYLEQFVEMAPNYLSEEFEGGIDDGVTQRLIIISVNLFNKKMPGIQYMHQGKKEWIHLCSIEDLCCISYQDNKTVVISRKTGIPIYLTLLNFESVVTFITLLDGYYRLIVKWTFNLCNDFITPSLQKLRALKCHGPVGGNFAYSKLREKRANKPGCFILRECDISYNAYFIDVCMADSKPSTFKIEHRGEGHYWFSGDEESYESIPALLAKHRTPYCKIPLLECIPPSEYDETDILLCRLDELASKTKNIKQGLPSEGPPCVIPPKHLHVYSGKVFSGRWGCTVVQKCLWKPENSQYKVDVAVKMLKPEYEVAYLKEYLELANSWSLLQSSAIVRLLGVNLSSMSLIFEFFPLGRLDLYLSNNKTMVAEVDLVEAATYIANAVWYMESEGIVHGYLRCHKILVTSHTDSSFCVKVADPGIHTILRKHDMHWIPPEHYDNPRGVKTHSSADMWALGTTLWQLFSFGEQPYVQEDLKKFYTSGKRLDKPTSCSNEVYKLMMDCWGMDPDQRKRPQAAMRDINQLLYQVYNSRRAHTYASAKCSLKDTDSSLSSMKHMSRSNVESRSFSTTSQLTNSSYIDDFQIDSDFIGDGLQLSHGGYEDGPNSSEINSFLSTLESGSSRIFEWDDDMATKNVVRQGLIGKGCYGEVYKAIVENPSNSSSDPQIVAVKKIINNRSSCLLDFDREICIMKSLKHPNIVEMKGVIYDPEVLLIMEYVPLGSLKSYLSINKNRLVPEKHFLKYSLDVAKGMVYLSQKNIIHRDLAARNVLVSNDLNVKISDFGLAQALGPAEDYYLLRTVRDLPINWYAPESLCDGKFSASSDVWSYGVLLYEIFTFGEDPVLNNVSTNDGTLYTLLKNDVRLPCPPKCPNEVYTELMMKCWRFKSKDRPSFKNIVETIEKIMSYHNSVIF